MFLKIKSYIVESKQEFKRVNWPTKQETGRMTLVVVVFSLATAAFLGALDFVFRYLLGEFIL
jgi:preprotein translocase SecE subunit